MSVCACAREIEFPCKCERRSLCTVHSLRFAALRCALLRLAVLRCASRLFSALGCASLPLPPLRFVALHVSSRCTAWPRCPSGAACSAAAPCCAPWRSVVLWFAILVCSSLSFASLRGALHHLAALRCSSLRLGGATIAPSSRIAHTHRACASR